MNSSPASGAVIYAKDMVVLSIFYSTVRGLNVRKSEAAYVILESSSLQVVIQQIPLTIAQTIHINKPPGRRTDTPIKLIFSVESIRQVRTLVRTLGGALNPPESIWTFEGHKVCDGHDPEGNVFQVREPIIQEYITTNAK